MPLALVSKYSFTIIPLSTRIPLSLASSTFGVIPTAISSMSVSNLLLFDVIVLFPCISFNESLSMKDMPLLSRYCCITLDTFSSTNVFHIYGITSTTVVFTPSVVRLDATSTPTKPARLLMHSYSYWQLPLPCRSHQVFSSIRHSHFPECLIF